MPTSPLTGRDCVLYDTCNTPYGACRSHLPRRDSLPLVSRAFPARTRIFVRRHVGTDDSLHWSLHASCPKARGDWFTRHCSDHRSIAAVIRRLQLYLLGSRNRWYWLALRHFRCRTRPFDRREQPNGFQTVQLLAQFSVRIDVGRVGATRHG